MNTLHTKKFWLQVQREHQNAPEQHAEFLCNSSSAFALAWAHNRADIHELAAMFVAQDEHWNSLVGIDTDGSVLFYPIVPGTLLLLSRRALRKQFIEWNIKRVS